MQNIQAVSRLAVRTAVAAVPRRSMSMKQALSLENLGRHPNTGRYMKVMNVQKEWNKTPELLVWQKRGHVDQMTYMTTMTLVTLSTLLALSIIWKMSFPVKKD